MCKGTGIVCGLLGLLLLLKFVARKCGFSGLNRTLRKTHVPIGWVFVGLCVVHSLLALPILGDFSYRMLGAGAFATVLALSLLFSGRRIGKKPGAFFWHRIGSGLFLLSFLLHLMK